MIKRFKRTYTKTEIIGISIIVFSIGLCVDAVLGNFDIFAIVFVIGFLFLGQRQRNKGRFLLGNILIGFGVLILLGMVIASVAFKFVLIGLLAYFGYQLYRSKSHPKEVSIETVSTKNQDKEIIQVETFFKNMLFAESRRIENIYELDDINIQYGFGDVHIDLSLSFIPDGEIVIIIRGIVGSIRLYVPYDMELSMHSSLLLGKMDLLGYDEGGLNKTCRYQTKDYKIAARKIKIFSTLLVGDIEVRYV